MNDEQLLRYSRQIMLEQVDMAGQEKLLNASVLILGAGGLGCPAAMYLAAAGSGKLTIVDFDNVDLSNLQRQIAHGTSDIGNSKVSSLKSMIKTLNPDCEVTCLNQKIDSELLDNIISDIHVVLDCTDNFETRFAVNAACVKHQVPLVSGAAIRYEGQLMVYDPAQQQSPCYQCIYPATGEIEETCSENGVIAPLVGIIGSMQALEAAKLLTGSGSTSSGRLLLFDGLRMQWREIKTTVDPECPACQ